jgi:hypothetical protein
MQVLITLNKFNKWKPEVNLNPDYAKFILLALKMVEFQMKVKPWETTLWLNVNCQELLSKLIFIQSWI